MEFMQGRKLCYREREKKTDGVRVKYIYIKNAMFSAQSDCIARRCQRCEDSDGCFCSSKAVHLKRTVIFTTRWGSCRNIPASTAKSICHG